MRRLAAFVVLVGTLAVLMLIVTPVPGDAICGDCSLTVHGYFCVSNPPTYAVCRAWSRTELWCFAGICTPHELNFCEAYAECAY